VEGQHTARAVGLVLDHLPITMLSEFTILAQEAFAPKLGKTAGTRRRYMASSSCDSLVCGAR
jgi:hypothetical protein